MNITVPFFLGIMNVGAAQSESMHIFKILFNIVKYSDDCKALEKILHDMA
jgi:hypothetical protein